jgi:hypothetical protein
MFHILQSTAKLVSLFNSTDAVPLQQFNLIAAVEMAGN